MFVDILNLEINSINIAQAQAQSCFLKVDLSKLETAALWRYWRQLNLLSFSNRRKLIESLFCVLTYWIAMWMLSPTHQKERPVDVVKRHFMSQQMDELQVIFKFVQATKRLKIMCKWPGEKWGKL